MKIVKVTLDDESCIVTGFNGTEDYARQAIMRALREISAAEAEEGQVK